MKRFYAIALAAALGLATAGVAHAVTASTGNYLYSGEDTYDRGLANEAYAVGDVANGINNSRHNLGAFGEHVTANGVVDNGNIIAGTTYTYGTTEVCVFCHTPHHAGSANTTSSSGSGAGMWTNAPLWNRGLQSALTQYTAYSAGGANRTTAQTDTTMVIGSASLACLSCHDGITALDNLINAPGPGKARAATDTRGIGGVTNGGSDRQWTFSEETTGFITSGRLKIGTDLTNDHPVSVAYTEDRASLRATSTVINTINLTIAMDGGGGAHDGSSVLAFDNGNLTRNWWAINGYINDTATIGDLLRANSAGGTRTQVECTSCHDPHFKNQSWSEVQSGMFQTGNNSIEVDGAFLRRVGGNTGSGVCRTCHAK